MSWLAPRRLVVVVVVSRKKKKPATTVVAPTMVRRGRRGTTDRRRSVSPGNETRRRARLFHAIGLGTGPASGAVGGSTHWGTGGAQYNASYYYYESDEHEVIWGIQEQ